MEGQFVDSGASLYWLNYSYTQNVNGNLIGDQWRANNIGVNFGMKYNKLQKLNLEFTKPSSFGLGNSYGKSVIWGLSR